MISHDDLFCDKKCTKIIKHHNYNKDDYSFVL